MREASNLGTLAMFTTKSIYCKHHLQYANTALETEIKRLVLLVSNSAGW